MSKQKKSARATFELAPAIEMLAKSSTFNSTERLAVAGRIAMAQHVRKLYKHLPGALAGDDPHDIHQMRVSTRRLRACLTSTAAAYKPEIVQQLRKRLRRLARTLGDVRDRDVMLIRLRDDVAKLSPEQSAALQQVIDRLQAERETAHATLIGELAHKRTTRLLHELTSFLSCPLEDVQADDGGVPLLVRHHAGSAIWQEYEAIRRFETVMPHASTEHLHELRIACKHLRYTLELFEPAMGQEANALIDLVTAMQEQLGHVHDADVAEAYLNENPEQVSTKFSVQEDKTEHMPDADEAAATDTSLRAYVEARAAERASLLAQVEELWRQLNSEQTRQQLSFLIAAL